MRNRLFLLIVFVLLSIVSANLSKLFADNSKKPKAQAENWFEYSRPIMEWLNPHETYDWDQYIETLIKNAKDANANTIYFVIDCGGSPVFNGSIEPKDRHLGDYDLLANLQRRLHEEDMYFVAAQFGAHTMSQIAERHPNWLVRDSKGNVVYGPGSVPLMCFNTGYGDYVASELGRVVENYKTDAIYLEGLYYPRTGCYCDVCQEKFKAKYGKPIPENVSINDLEVARFYMDALIDYVDGVNKTAKSISPETMVMACPANNTRNNGGILNLVDWKGLSEVCDIVTLERMWGHGSTYTLWEIGMTTNTMRAEAKKPVFTTSWYAHHVDREYTARTPATLKLNYFEALINGATPQHHTQNALEEVPDHIPVLNELYSFTEKVRPWFLGAERVNQVAILYDRNHYWADNHFSGYYRALTYHHVPFKVISRDDLNVSAMEGTEVLILPNTLMLSDDEVKFIKEFTKNGGNLIATFKTGFGSNNSKASVLSDLLGVESVEGEKYFGRLQGVGFRDPAGYRRLWNAYFKGADGSFVNDATHRSLMSFSGNLLQITPSKDASVVANTIGIDSSRHHLYHPAVGYYPKGIEDPLIIEKSYGKGKVIYFANEMDKVFLDQGYEFISKILVEATKVKPHVFSTDAPETVELTYYAKDEGYLVFMLNKTTNQRMPQPINSIIPVSDITLKVKGMKKAKTLSGKELKTKYSNGYLTIQFPKLEVIEAILIQ